MGKDLVASDCWIAGQLAGIRMLERELTQELQESDARKREKLRERVALLKYWVNLVDSVLSMRAQADHSAGAPALLS